ncbi:MAG: preprotein translocase subunit Sec61beta [Candidatus Micrarchaeota archaeon]|nr:preprotein translocase subunit Sec61beta [Candidatus Micrarchaeota archaeon]
MPGLYSPQSQAGVQSFYDAPTKGPKVDPRFIIAAILIFTAAVLIVDHIAFA